MTNKKRLVIYKKGTKVSVKCIKETSSFEGTIENITIDDENQQRYTIRREKDGCIFCGVIGQCIKETSILFPKNSLVYVIHRSKILRGKVTDITSDSLRMVEFLNRVDNQISRLYHIDDIFNSVSEIKVALFGTPQHKGDTNFITTSTESFIL